MNQKGRTLLIVLLIAAAIGGYLIYSGKINTSQKQVACTMDAKICPDGSGVGRVGPKCEFAPCPSAKTDETANWKIYTNAKYGYSVSYPGDTGLVLKEDKTIIKKLDGLTQLETSSIYYPNSDQAASFTIWNNPQKVSIQDWWDTNFNNLYFGYSPAVNKKQIKTSFKKIGQTKVFFADIGGPRSGPYYIAQNDVVIEINSTVSELFDKILSTFKFQ